MRRQHPLFREYAIGLKLSRPEVDDIMRVSHLHHIAMNNLMLEGLELWKAASEHDRASARSKVLARMHAHSRSASRSGS